MEELDTFKTEVFRDFQDNNEVIYRKIDEVSSQLFRLQSEKQEHKTQLISMDQYSNIIFNAYIAIER